MKIEVSREWCMQAAEREGDAEVGAGILASDPVLQWKCDTCGQFIEDLRPGGIIPCLAPSHPMQCVGRILTPGVYSFTPIKAAT